MVIVERLKDRCENVGCGKLRVDLCNDKAEV